MDKHHPGFTLLELLVALAIVALLASLSVPAYQTVTLNLKLRSAVSNLASDLHYARFAAVDRNDAIAICPGTMNSGCSTLPDWHLGWIIFHDLNHDRRWQSTEPVLRLGMPIRGLTIHSAASRRVISFSPSGAAGGTNATLRFCDHRGAPWSRQIRVSLTGRIRSTAIGDPLNTSCS